MTDYAGVWGTVGHPAIPWDARRDALIKQYDAQQPWADEGSPDWAIPHDGGWLIINDDSGVPSELVQYLGEGARWQNPPVIINGAWFQRVGDFHARRHQYAPSFGDGRGYIINDPKYGYIIPLQTFRAIQVPWAKARGGFLESVLSNAPIIMATAFAGAAVSGALAPYTAAETAVAAEATAASVAEAGFVTDAELAEAAAGYGGEAGFITDAELAEAAAASDAVVVDTVPTATYPQGTGTGLPAVTPKTATDIMKLIAAGGAASGAGGSGSGGGSGQYQPVTYADGDYSAAWIIAALAALTFIT